MTTMTLKIREVGLLSISYRLCGGKGNRSIHYRSSSEKSTKDDNYKVCSASSHGNTASNWAVSPQSPPVSENSVVVGACTT